MIGAVLVWAMGQAPGWGVMLASTVSPGLVVQGMVTALILGIVGGLYPAWTAANLQPVEALRYEGGGATASTGWLGRIGNQSFRNLWRRRNRTLLSAAGIGIGVGTLVMLGGMMKGMIGQLNGLTGSGGAGNITVMQRDVADMSLSSLDERMVRQILAMPEVKTASPFMLAVISSPEMPMFLLGGLDPNSPAMRHYKLVAGRYMQRPNEIVLGKVAAETYKVGIGDTLNLNDNRYKVVGITQTGTAYEDAGGMLALREAQRLMGRPRAVSFIFVDVKDPAQTQAVVERDQYPVSGSAGQPEQRVCPEQQRPADDAGDGQRHPGAGADRRRHRGGEHHDHVHLRAHARDRHAARARLAPPAHLGADPAGEPLVVPGRGRAGFAVWRRAAEPGDDGARGRRSSCRQPGVPTYSCLPL